MEEEEEVEGEDEERMEKGRRTKIAIESMDVQLNCTKQIVVQRSSLNAN